MNVSFEIQDPFWFLWYLIFWFVVLRYWKSRGSYKIKSTVLFLLIISSLFLYSFLKQGVVNSYIEANDYNQESGKLVDLKKYNGLAHFSVNGVKFESSYDDLYCSNKIINLHSKDIVTVRYIENDNKTLLLPDKCIFSIEFLKRDKPKTRKERKLGA